MTQPSVPGDGDEELQRSGPDKNSSTDLLETTPPSSSPTTRSVVPVAGKGDVAPPSRFSWSGIRWRAISLATLILLWFCVSVFFDETTLPGPTIVGGALWENLQDAETYSHLFVTVRRVVGGMLIAIFLGVAIGLIMGLSKIGEQFLDSWVLVAFTVPSVVYGILAILWFGLNDMAAVIAIGITAVPAVAMNIWQSVKGIDFSLVRMGKAFHFSRWSILRNLILPQVIPNILAALRYALGIAWNIATTIELIGLSSGVGYQLNYWFGLFNMTQVLAWTIVFTLVLLFIEYAVLKPIEYWATRWRPNNQV